MCKFFLATVLLAFSWFSNNIFAQSEVARKEPTFVSTEVAKGLFVLQGKDGFTGGNIAISVGEDGVVMIDDSMPPLLGKLRAAIEKLSDKPVDFLINTHVHGDHTGNNVSFGVDGAHIVAHTNLRKRLREKKVDSPQGKVLMPASGLPVITFPDSISFHLNGGEIRVFHLANAHTDGDAIIHFRDLNVIHTGDILFSGMFPFIDLDNGGSVDGYIAAQKKIYSLADDQTVVIPGHGPIGKKNQLQASIDMLVDAQSLVEALVKKGKTEEQVVAENPLKKLHQDWNWNFITTEKITRTLFRDITRK